MMKDKYRYLLKNVFLLSLNGFLPKVLSFLMVPFYTGILTTAEYGVSDLITTTVYLLVPIFTCDIQDAVMRFAMDRNCEPRHVFGIGLRSVLVGSALVCVGAVAVNCFHIPGLQSEYLFFMAVMFFSTALRNMVSLFCRAIDRVQTIVIGSVVHSIVTLTANIFLLAVVRMGLTGYLIANSVGEIAALVVIFLHARLYRYITFRIPAGLQKNMLTYSFPLVFSVIAWWVNNASDRYILTWISGVAVSGVYAVSYKIPSILTTFQNIFSQAWSISAIKEFDSEDSTGFIGNMYTAMSSSMVLLCSVIMLINVPLARLLYAKEFFEAWMYVPPLLISVVFNAMGLFLGSIFTAVKDTKTASISTITGALVNTGCNFLLISLLGGYGAAVATLIGYAVVLLMRWRMVKRHIRMKVKAKRDLASYVLLLVQMGIAAGGWKLMPLQVPVLLAIVLLYRAEGRYVLGAIKSRLPVGSGH